MGGVRTIVTVLGLLSTVCKAQETSNTTNVCSAPDLSFAGVLAKFERFHRDPVNVGLHVLTTPVIYLGWLSIATKGMGFLPVVGLGLAYVLTLPFHMSEARLGVLPVALVIFAIEVLAARQFSQHGWLLLLLTP